MIIENQIENGAIVRNKTCEDATREFRVISWEIRRQWRSQVLNQGRSGSNIHVK